MEILFLSKYAELGFGRKEKAPMYTLKSEVFPSLLIVLLGSIDCVTTVIGILYFGAAELNPFLTGIVNASIWAFLAVKVSATLFIGYTFIAAKRMLGKTPNKQTKSFKFSNRLLTVAYGGLMVFLFVVVANNLIILLA